MKDKTKDITPQEKKQGGSKQLSKIAITERIRSHVPELLEEALKIAKNGDSDSNKIGAIKLLLSKVIPDLKSTELDLGERTKFLIELIKENDRKENPTSNQELPKPGVNIPTSGTV